MTTPINFENPFTEADCDAKSSIVDKDTGVTKIVYNNISIERANTKFREILEGCPKVYTDKRWDIWSSEYNAEFDTHSARLICVEKLK